MTTTLGQLLIHSAMPVGHKFENTTVDKNEIVKGLSKLAIADPKAYVKIVTELKQLGDEFATYEGISVGLDDIEPNYVERDKIVADISAQMKKATDVQKKREILLKAQDQLETLTKQHKGDMSLMAKSGGRGNIPQLMKTVTSPALATDWSGAVVPWFVKKSYAEGLSPSELWVTGAEARKNTIAGVTSVVEPGAMGKLLVRTMENQVIASDDCGTTNGILLPTDSPDIVDRYIAKTIDKFPHNTLITSQVADYLQKHFKQVLVRSPMTCEIHQGVCSKCFGLNTKGNPGKLGTNIGMQAAQAMSEPLVQAMLSSKHAASIAKGATKEPRGFSGFKRLTTVPEAFAGAAVLAKKYGTIDSIESAPQGGHFISVDGIEHHIPPDLDILVKKHEIVEAGDRLSSGISKPNEVMELKGLGVGRQHYVDVLHKVFKDSITDIDRRHLEVLAKAQLSHAEVVDDPHGDLLRGDIIHFNRLKERLQDETKEINTVSAEGKMLSKSYNEFMAGTTVTPSVMRSLEDRGIHKVEIAINPPKLLFVMKPITHAPLLNPDWLARMAHMYLKKTILDASAYGETSNIHGYHPVPAYVVGTTFGEGNKGAY